MILLLSSFIKKNNNGKFTEHPPLTYRLNVFTSFRQWLNELFPYCCFNSLQTRWQCPPHDSETGAKMCQQATKTTKSQLPQTCRVHAAVAKTSCESEAATRRVEKVVWLILKGETQTGCKSFISALRVCPSIWLHICCVCLEEFIFNSLMQWRQLV